MAPFRSFKDELAKMVSTDVIKAVHSVSASSVAAADVAISDDILTNRDKSAALWIGPYLVAYCDVKMIKVNAGDRMFDILIYLVRKHARKKLKAACDNNSVYNTSD